MKKSLFIFSFVFGALLGSFAFGQEPAAPAPEQRVVTSNLLVPGPMPVDIDIREQPDAPIHLSVDESIKGRLPGTPIKVRNDSGSVVAAFVLRADFEPFGLNEMVIIGPKGLAAGEARLQGLAVSSYREGSPKPVVSVDYVQFADGTSWGEDSLGRSKDVTEYLKGRNEALARVKEMLAGQDATDVNRAFDVYSSSSFGEPRVLPGGRAPRYVDYYVRGYEEVINILQRLPRNTELGKDLAGSARTRRAPSKRALDKA
jgi:hypothetical protein